MANGNSHLAFLTAPGPLLDHGPHFWMKNVPCLVAVDLFKEC